MLRPGSGHLPRRAGSECAAHRGSPAALNGLGFNVQFVYEACCKKDLTCSFFFFFLGGGCSVALWYDKLQHWSADFPPKGRPNAAHDGNPQYAALSSIARRKAEVLERAYVSTLTF